MHDMMDTNYAQFGGYCCSVILTSPDCFLLGCILNFSLN